VENACGEKYISNCYLFDRFSSILCFSLTVERMGTELNQSELVNLVKISIVRDLNSILISCTVFGK